MCDTNKVDNIHFYVTRNITDVSEEMATTASSDRGGQYSFHRFCDFQKSVERRSLVFGLCEMSYRLVETKHYRFEETLLVYRPKIINRMNITISGYCGCPSIFVLIKVRANDAVT